MVFSAGVSAQNTKQPPKTATILKTPEFVSEEGGFKANFPGKPEKRVSTIEAAYGKTDYTTFQHATNTAFYMVAYLDFPTVIKDKTELRLRFDQLKNSMTEKQNARLIEEREVFFGEYLGHDYVFEIGNLTVNLRSLIIEQRLFQLTVSTRGNVTKSSENIKKYNSKLVDNFFNSFAVTKLPAPKSVAVELPQDFGVKIQDSGFRSDYFKFSINLPAEFAIVDEEEATYLKELGVEESKNQLPNRAKELDYSIQNTKILLTMMRQDAETALMFIIGAEKTSFPNFLPSAITDNYLKRFLEPAETVVTKTTLTKIGGVEFAWIETANSTDNLKQRLYVANRNGIALQLYFTYRNAKDLEVLMKSIQSIKFEENAPVSK
jgi:hypothetical protein